ncbi:MAG TPA: ABC transporter permease [Terracidiphilus sp.]|nr:ABC transporter permease [Terracidiphilus sp.]
MILSIARTALVALRRDRAALALAFILPVAFFTIFAVIFGGQHNATPRVTVVVVDQDRSEASRQLVAGLEQEGSLDILTTHSVRGQSAVPFDFAAAQAAVKAGDAPVALIIPKGFGDRPITLGPALPGVAIRMLNDTSDAIAPQVVMGLLQKVAMVSMRERMAQLGLDYAAKEVGGFTPGQKKRLEDELAALHREMEADANRPSGAQASSSDDFSGLIKVDRSAVAGESQNKNVISFYAAAIGVMFLLFTASGSAGSLLDEAESGALDRVLSSRVTMGTLLGGKLFYNTLLAFTQLVVMFVWAWAAFKMDFFSHIPGFLVMGLSSAVTVAAFGILLASMCRTRAQLGAISTLLILMMSAIGGSMFPRYLMPPAVQKAGLFTINAWAIDGFTKVFWRDLPISSLWPQVLVLLTAAAALFLVARRAARRWECA